MTAGAAAVAAAAPVRRSGWQLAAPAVVAVAVAAASCAGLRWVSPAVATVPAAHQVLVTGTALVVQACPFVIAGGALSAVVAVFVRPEHWRAIVPAHPVGACVVGVAVGVLVPTCECASVPLARRMMAQGVCPPAAVGFMVAAPSLNPLVLAATAAAFGDGRAAVVRGVAGLVAVAVTVASVAVGWIGDRAGAGLVSPGPATATGAAAGTGAAGLPVWSRFLAAARSDIGVAIAFLCVGGLIAGVARLVLGGVGVWNGGTVEAPGAGSVWSTAASVAVGAGLAVVGSLCSYGDGFVAASLPLPGLARVVFLAVGPIVDVKLAGLMAAQLGWQLSWRIAAGGLAGGVVGGCVATLAMPGVI